jgi:predicted metalloprotease with PDZ domain
MAICKEDISRAVSILKNCLIAFEEEKVYFEEESNRELKCMEKTVDAICSPLFHALIDISNEMQADHASNFTELGMVGSTPLLPPRPLDCDNLTNELIQVIASHAAEASEIRDISLIKETPSLGLNIVGLSRSGLFISEIDEEGVAYRSGSLRVGDKILSINDINCENMASFEALHYIEQMSLGEIINLKVQYNPAGLVDHLNTIKRH